MKKREKYLPLAYAEQCMEADTLETFKRNGMIPESTTPSEYLNFVLSPEFLNPVYNGPFAKLNRFVINRSSSMAGMNPEMMKLGVQERVELQDILATEILVKNWLEYKRVYKFDPDFFLELVQTEKIGIPKGLLLNLPFDCFYADLSAVKDDISPFVGAFVKMLKTSRGEQLAIYMITEKMYTFSYYTNLFYDENGIADILFTDPSVPMVYREMGNTGNILYAEVDNRQTVINAIIQIVLFLSAGNSDQKLSQRPRTQTPGLPKAKLRYSDIEFWDVGVRYGAAIRTATRAKEETHAVRTGSRERKAPRPHIRCAHWQRYHVGEGRKETKVNWILPTFVGNKEVPVTIQEIK